jgi:DNA-binding SARP family transcriptional activator/tetratricopeptide (TPR) repeat protein
VEFGLLGPLVVRSGHTAVQVSAGKQRALLAALLLDANQVVAISGLAEAIWQGRPPETARVTLQNYVMRLRHTLGPAGYERIISCPSGYLIEVHPGELDLAQFTELHGAGLAAARAGAWEDASAQLAAALKLWRGRPLADVPSPLLAAKVPGLAEMRLVALETRIDADLHLYRHHDVTAELAALATAEPLRERVHELLMLALYRSGQQAAALAAYRRARRRIVDELGIEPGPALRELNQRILRSDPTLRLHPPPGDRPPQGGGAPRDRGGRPGPSMLPAGVPGFTGRDAELRALSAMLPAPAPGHVRPGAVPRAHAAPGGSGPVLITAVGGTAGVGKTALAVHWAREHAADFPGGQLYVNLRGFGPADPMPPGEALRIFLDALAVPAAGTGTLDGLRALYRSRLAGTKTLIVLDNARDPDQVRPLLPAEPACLVIVTSRNELTGLIAAEGAHPITLDVLAAGDARQLLIRRLGPERVAAEPDAATELIGRCARLPLALAIAAARATARPGFPLAALAAELRDARSRLSALGTGEDTTDVRAVFSWSYHQLSPAAARMFRLLGLHPGPDATAPAAASLAGVTPAEARRLLRELTRDRLLTEYSPGRFALHDLLRAYATEQAEAIDLDADRRAAIHRALDHYLRTAHAATLLLSPQREPIELAAARPDVTPEPIPGHQQALGWFEAEHGVLAAAITLAAGTGFDAHAWQLAWTMATFLDRRGYWHEWAAIQRIAVAATARLGDTAGQAVTFRILASARIKVGDYEGARASLAECLRLYGKLGDRSGQARTHEMLSLAAGRQDRHADALGHAEQALRLFEAVGNQAGRAQALNTVGWYHGLLGDYRRARTFCKRALALCRTLGDRHGEAGTWDSLGYAEHQLGKLTDAVACYESALSLFRELGDRLSEATILTHLGDSHTAAGDRQRGRDAWQHALAILDDLNHPDAGAVRAKLASADDRERRQPAAAGTPSSQRLGMARDRRSRPAGR